MYNLRVNLLSSQWKMKQLCQWHGKPRSQGLSSSRPLGESREEERPWEQGCGKVPEW